MFFGDWIVVLLFGEGSWLLSQVSPALLIWFQSVMVYQNSFSLTNLLYNTMLCSQPAKPGMGSAVLHRFTLSPPWYL